MTYSSQSDAPTVPLLLNPSHKETLVAHLLLLPAEQRYTRFIGTMTDSAIRSFVANVDFEQDLLVGLPWREGGFRAVVQCSPHSIHARELAFSTAPAFQRQGLATRLGNWMLDHIAGIGAREAFIYCVQKNIAMRGLARKLGFSLHVADGEVVANRPLNSPRLQRP